MHDFPRECVNPNETFGAFEEGMDYCNEVHATEYMAGVVPHRAYGHDSVDVPCKIAFRRTDCPQDAPPCYSLENKAFTLCEHDEKVECLKSEGTTPIWWVL